MRSEQAAGIDVPAVGEGAVQFPARFQLVLAADPCPCAPGREERHLEILRLTGTSAADSAVGPKSTH